MNILFKNYKDEKPAHGSDIIYVRVSEFYGDWGFEFATVEYCWDDLHGCQITWNGETILEGFELCIGFGNMYNLANSEKNIFWAYKDDIEDILIENGV